MTALPGHTPPAGHGVLLGVVIAVFAVLYSTGFFELIRDADAVRAIFDQLGVLAPILYLAGYALLTPFFVPGLVFVIPGAVVWSWLPLFLLTWLGGTFAGIVGFGFARYLGRDWVARRLPERLRRQEARLVERGLRTVILLRFSLYIAPPGHWLLGLSRVGFPTFVAGTLIGLLPGSLLISAGVVFAGRAFGDFFAAQPFAAQPFAAQRFAAQRFADQRAGFWIALVALLGVWVAFRRWRVRGGRPETAAIPVGTE